MERNDTVIAEFSLSLLPVLVGQDLKCVWANMCVLVCVFVCVCSLYVCVSVCE